MAALALGAVSIALMLAGPTAAQARTSCNNQVIANTFVAFRIAVAHPVTCDEATGAIRSFLQHGVIEGWRCQEHYVIPHEVTCRPDGSTGDVFFVYKPHSRTTRGVTTAHGITPLAGRYVGPGGHGREVSFGFDARRSIIFNFRVKGSIFTVGLPTEHFTVSLDVPNP